MKFRAVLNFLLAQCATELRPESKDAFGGPEIAVGVAEVHTILGDKARAIETLEGLLSRPSIVAAQGLKVNPIWILCAPIPLFKNSVRRNRTEYVPLFGGIWAPELLNLCRPETLKSGCTGNRGATDRAAKLRGAVLQGEEP
jgi:hypothetical protein